MERDDFAVNADFIIPVPMSRFKRERRGFNQAEIIAEALSEKLSVPVRTDTLKKHGSFVAQHKLKREKRQANVSHLYYKGNTENLEGKTVILVDDVVTTGSTLNECAKLLVSFGVKEIIAVAAATTLK
jgi:ComF family protein